MDSEQSLDITMQLNNGPVTPPVQFDIFISYASEDRNSIARPLYDVLMKKGWAVWFDEAVLELGDSLRRKIDEGLSKCRYGVVILSPDFFRKEWPRKELDGLVARETASEGKAILPVWHNINQVGVAAHSPILADRVAAKSSDGVEAVAEKVIGVLSAGREVVGQQRGTAQEPANDVAGISFEMAEYFRISRPGPDSPESAAQQYLRIGIAPGFLEVTRKAQSRCSVVVYDVVIDGTVVGKIRSGETAHFFVRPGYRKIWLTAHHQAYSYYDNPRSFSRTDIPAHDESSDTIIRKFNSGEHVRLYSQYTETFFSVRWVFVEHA